MRLMENEIDLEEIDRVVAEKQHKEVLDALSRLSVVLGGSDKKITETINYNQTILNEYLKKYRNLANPI